jgi:hypothetical protein
MKYTKYPQLKSNLGKVCTLTAACLILPALAYADNDKGKGGEKNGKGNDHRPPMVSTPEANVGWVLVPFFGAVLLFSARHLFRGKAAERSGS